MRILLIQPKMNKRPMDSNLKTRMAPSLALLTLIKLTPDQHEIILVNENVGKINYNQKIDLVAITVTVDVMPRASRIAEEFRKRSIPVIAGGIHVTCSPESCIPHFDAICVGPAERIWNCVLQDVENHTLQQIYSDMKNFSGDEIVSPSYEILYQEKYLYTNIVTSSRGCPNRCDFCYNSCSNRIYVSRPVSDVLRDIEILKTRHILFVDDNFIGIPSYTKVLLNKIKPLNLAWAAAVTTKILDHLDLLDLMAETGCQSLFIGFESMNSKSLENVHKDNIVEKYGQLVKAIHSRGIMVNASMVFGLDEDGPDIFKSTLDWLVSHKIETLTSHILTPYPGTNLYKRMEKEGRISSFDLGKYNTAHVVFKPSGMTEKELHDGYLWMYRKFYSYRNIIRRFPEHKKQRKAYLLFNLFYRKFGGFVSFVTRLIPMQVLGKIAAQISYKI